jgi:hypothetical protein
MNRDSAGHCQGAVSIPLASDGQVGHRGHRSSSARVLFVGLPWREGSFAQDLLQSLMNAQPSLEIVAATTPAPERFRELKSLSSIEFLQKDDFELLECILRLNEKHKVRVSRELLERHYRTEYTYLSISDRRCLTGLPVYKRRDAFRQLLAYWYHFLVSRQIDSVVVLGYPHAGWNNVLVDVAMELSLKVVLLDFTSIDGTTLVADMTRLHEPVPKDRYSHLPFDQIREAIPSELLERTSRPASGLDFVGKMRRDVQSPSRFSSYYFLAAGLLRNPLRRRRPSIARLSGDLTQFSMTMRSFEARQRISNFATRYEAMATKQPDLGKRYVYLPLHMQPERSTTPCGGVFEDQLLVAEILSASLPDGWILYVKEHSSQFWQKRAIKQAMHRDHDFYRRLAALPNTELVSLGCHSLDLIQHAMIVATVTGTAGWEALLEHKPCIVFGKPWYLGCNASFGVSSIEECTASISQASTMSAHQVDRDVLEFLLHYSDRILPIPFLPKKTAEQKEDYWEHTNRLATAVSSTFSHVEQNWISGAQ